MPTAFFTPGCFAQAGAQPGLVTEEKIRWLEMPEPWVVGETHCVQTVVLVFFWSFSFSFVADRRGRQADYCRAPLQPLHGRYGRRRRPSHRPRAYH